MEKERNIAWVAIMKDCKEYLESPFETQISKLEAKNKTLGINMHYYILENGSKDGTRNALEKFLEGRSGRIVSLEKELKPISNTGGIHYERIERLSYLRNYLLNDIREDLKRIEADWVVLFDADVVFDEDVLQELLSCNPRDKGIGMISPFALHVHDVEKLSAEMKERHADKIKGRPLISFGHYYDSFALYYNDGHNTWPHCRFTSCTQCSEMNIKYNITCIKTNTEDPLEEVRSIFGGFSMVDGSLLQDPRVCWDWVNMNTSSISICEHFFFCERIRLLHDKKIVLHKAVSVLCIV